MHIESRSANGILVATMKGRMDALTAPEFDIWFSERMQSGEHRLVLDMGGLDYISSAGLRSLLAAAKRIKSSEGAVILSGVTGTVAEVLKMSGFMSIFNVVATSEEALSAMG